MNFSINSKRLRIRQFEPDDVEDFVSFMVDPDSTQFLAFEEAQKNRKGATELLFTTIDSYASATPFMAYAIEERTSGKFAGFCGLTPREEGEVEIMYAIMPNFRSKGYAAEAASRLAQYAVDQLGYRRVIAPISPNHVVSKAVAAKAGFDDHGLRKSLQSSEKIHLYVYEKKDS
ncbi:MAG: GNAT family N-acetyltransferase [Gammaproteobacteria bacterium]|nr:GNAT family N-acetyltransferase [Gammaproteobacteria bacterium]